MRDDIKVIEEKVLSHDWYLLKKTVFDLRRRDVTWQRQSRETYDRGNGATILLYNRAGKTVILTRQFRFPTCPVSCDHIPRRSWPLFRARAVLRSVIESMKQEATP